MEDVFFQGVRIKTCFTQINISEMLSSLTLQTNNNETYCNLYYRNGESLTNDNFGYLSAGKNLLSELKKAEMKAGSSYERLKEDFDKGRGGQVSFQYQGEDEELCYVPVEGTDWMLTILIQNNVVSSQIGSISSAMMRRSIIQIAVTVFAMLVVFSLLIYQYRRSADFLLEQEKADSNRIRSAYAQIAREQTAMDNIHAAMGSGSWSMEFNAKREMVSCTWSDVFRKMVGYESEKDFPNRIESWSDLLHQEERENILKEYWNTVNDYTNEKTYDVEYRLLTRHAGWRWFHAAGRLSRREDGSPVTFVGLFVDINDEKQMKQQLERQKIDLEDVLAFKPDQ